MSVKQIITEENINIYSTASSDKADVHQKTKTIAILSKLYLYFFAGLLVNTNVYVSFTRIFDYLATPPPLALSLQFVQDTSICLPSSMFVQLMKKIIFGLESNLEEGVEDEQID